MAKSLFYILLFIMSTRVCAQSESPRHMLEEGKSWIYNYHHFESRDTEGDPYMDPYTEDIYPVRYTIIGDTVIDNKSYYKMYREVDNKKSYYAAYREEGLKVYMRNPEFYDIKNMIVADFEYEGLYSLVGEKEEKYSKIKEYIDYVEVNGIQYRRHTYYVNEVDEKLAIGVEGIGYYYNGLNYPSIYGVVLSCICDYEEFVSCEVNGKTIFDYSDFLKEGVTTSVSSIGDKSDSADHIYDLQGRRLSATPQKGVYIQNGKKKLVK